MTTADIIKRCQLRIGETADGIAGPKTWEAIAKAIGADLSEMAPVTSLPDPPTPGEHVDVRSEAAIATLHRIVQPKARQLVELAAQNGITVKITSGTRTYAEQDRLFAQGGVTKARGGQSNHNFGLAIDLTIFQNDEPVWESTLYKTLGKLGKSLGFTWGGDWTSIVDEPHFEIHPPWAAGMTEGQMLSELRRRHDAGEDAFA